MSRLTIPNPESRLWSGVFPGELSGNLFLTKSIDLERSKGKIGIADSYAGIVNSSQAGFANLTTSIAFVRTAADGTDRWWALAGRMFKTTGTDPETGWIEDALANSPTAPENDMVDFLGALLVSTDTNIDRLSTTWTNNWWSSLTGASAMTTAPHRFVIFAGAVLITDGRFINDYDGTIARDPALTLPVGFEARWMLVWQDLVFIGGANTVGRDAEIFTWKRDLGTFAARYDVGDSEALCGFVVDVPYIVTKKGAIKKFTGSGFTTVQQFPTVEVKQSITLIHPNGVSVEENVVKLLVNMGVSNGLRIISGIWTFDAITNNLYHSGSIQNTTTRDYAQLELADVGAMVYTSPTQGLYLIGAQVYTTYSSVTRYGIFSSQEEATSNQSYFITPKLYAQDVQRFWRLLFLRMNRLDNADDRVRVCVRYEESLTLPAYETITWTAANQFTASNANIQAGDFVEIIAGENAGAIARITTISGTTVTIDRSLFTSSVAARARYLRFFDLGTISNQAVQRELFHVTTRSPWVQFLIELRGTETSPIINDIILDFQDYQL